MNRVRVQIVSLGAAVILAIAISPAQSPTGGSATASAGAASSPASMRGSLQKLTISRETTFLLGPMNLDGSVNYLAALNEELAKGVTPENNAAIPLIKALGPEFLDAKYRNEVLNKLGMPPFASDEVGLVFPQALYENLLKACERPWTAKDFPELDEWLRGREAQINLLHEAAKRPRFFVPLVSPSHPPSLVDYAVWPKLAELRLAARIMIARAMFMTAAGEQNAACDELLRVHCLASVIVRRNLVSCIVGASVDGLTCQAEQVVLRDGKLAGLTARRYLADLQSLPPMPALADILDRGERFFALEFIMLIRREGLDKALRRADISHLLGKEPEPTLPEVPLDFDQLLRLTNVGINENIETRRLKTTRLLTNLAASSRPAEDFAETFRVIAKVKAAIDKLSPEDRKDPKKTTPAVWDAMTDNNFFGRSLVFLDKLAMQQRLVMIGFALEAQRAEAGEYPASLDKLAPALLPPAVLQDMFSDKPVKYRREGKGYIVYSVGENMKDDGGVSDEGKQTDDIILKIAR